MTEPIRIEGRVFNNPFADNEIYGGPANGGWIERIDRKAFEKALASNPNIPLTLGAWAVATTGDGTLKVNINDEGVSFVAAFDLDDPHVSPRTAEARKRLVRIIQQTPDLRANYDMRVSHDEWLDSDTRRLITEAQLEQFTFYADPVVPGDS